MTTINTSWDRIEAWLGQNAPGILAGLALGATDAEIAVAEKELGIEFPHEVRESYMRHDGQMYEKDGYTTIGGCLVNGHDLLSLQKVMSEWRSWKDLLDAGTFARAESDPDGGIKSNWWNIKWIPFTHNCSGDHLCLDCDPAPGGKSGQVITMWHDAHEREVVADNFAQWLEQFAQDLETGEQVYSDDYGGIVCFGDI